MLFLESPAFVGFSYSNTTSDSVVGETLRDSCTAFPSKGTGASFCLSVPCVTVFQGDKRTALDAYRFLLEIMKRFPELADRPLWLSGESYGGHYVPGLADAIVKVTATALQN